MALLGDGEAVAVVLSVAMDLITVVEHGLLRFVGELQRSILALFLH